MKKAEQKIIEPQDYAERTEGLVALWRHLKATSAEKIPEEVLRFFLEWENWDPVQSGLVGLIQSLRLDPKAWSAATCARLLRGTESEELPEIQSACAQAIALIGSAASEGPAEVLKRCQQAYWDTSSAPADEYVIVKLLGRVG